MLADHADERCLHVFVCDFSFFFHLCLRANCLCFHAHCICLFLAPLFSVSLMQTQGEKRFNSHEVRKGVPGHRKKHVEEVHLLRMANETYRSELDTVRKTTTNFEEHLSLSRQREGEHHGGYEGM
jgi:hypothetical protein